MPTFWLLDDIIDSQLHEHEEELNEIFMDNQFNLKQIDDLEQALDASKYENEDIVSIDDVWNDDCCGDKILRNIAKSGKTPCLFWHSNHRLPEWVKATSVSKISILGSDNEQFICNFYTDWQGPKKNDDVYGTPPPLLTEDLLAVYLYNVASTRLDSLVFNKNELRCWNDVEEKAKKQFLHLGGKETEWSSNAKQRLSPLKKIINKYGPVQ